MNLKQILINKNVSKYQLSKMTSITQAYLGKLERGECEATESKIIRICLALGVTPNELLGFEEILYTIKKNLG